MKKNILKSSSAFVICLFLILSISGYLFYEKIEFTSIIYENKILKASPDTALVKGTYTSKDGHKIVINEDNTILYDDSYALTLKESEKGNTLTGKLGTDKKSTTF